MNVHRTAVACRDDRNAVASRLDERESERLLQRDVDEHAAGGVRKPVDVGNIRLRVMLGTRDGTVDVVAVDEAEDVVDDRLRTNGQLLDAPSRAENEHEICKIFEPRRGSVRLDEAGDVLLGIGAAHCKNDRLTRRPKESVDGIPHRRLRGCLHEVSHGAGDGSIAAHHHAIFPHRSFLVAGATVSFRRISPACSILRGGGAIRLPAIRLQFEATNARWDHLHQSHRASVPRAGSRLAKHGCQARCVAVVQCPLLRNFLRGGRDDDVRDIQRALFAFDAPADVVLLFHLGGRDAASPKQVLELVAPEAVPRENHGNAERACDVCGNLARVGVVAVHARESNSVVGLGIQCRERLLDDGNAPVAVLAQVRPQLLLGVVYRRIAALQTSNEAASVRPVERLERHAVGLVDAVNIWPHESREQVNARNVRVPSQFSRHVDDVLHLSTRICILAQFHLLATHESVDGHHDDVQVGRDARWCPRDGWLSPEWKFRRSLLLNFRFIFPGGCGIFQRRG
mmetsp:Transcript_8379/g.22340  ORF Transcript_8379/g.22340 Transcript_8379/m.22340 type:complete len:512 (+) Transcript_8379:254-1789(+)